MQKNRWIVKIGSALLTNNGKGLDVQKISGWVSQMVQLRRQGIELVLVSSGAIAAGMSHLGWTGRPHAIQDLQAAAAVGQTRLMKVYEQEFERFQLNTAQILLDHDDMSSRQRYLNARATLRTLIDIGVVPVVNENDTVVTDEIRFGDNDTLSALVANLVEANLLIILTDQQGLYDSDPRKNSGAMLISDMQVSDKRLDIAAGEGSGLGRGGMITKVRAARLAARTGANTVIVGGRIKNVLLRLSQGKKLGSFLFTKQSPQPERKRWLAGLLQFHGILTLDMEAAKMLREHDRSLMPVGVTDIQGQFNRGDMVVCVEPLGQEIARGLINYNFSETHKIIGHSSDRIEQLLGYKVYDELVHRENLILTFE